MEASCRITMAQQAWQINGDATMVVWISSANSYMWLMTWMIRFLHRTHAALLRQFDRDTSTPVSTLPIQDVNLSVQWKAALKFWEFYDYWKVSELDRRTRTRNVTHQLAPVKDLLELVILRCQVLYYALSLSRQQSSWCWIASWCLQATNDFNVWFIVFKVEHCRLFRKSIWAL